MAKPMEIPIDDAEPISGDDVKGDVAALRSDVEKLMSDVASLARQEVQSGVESSAEMKEELEKQITELSDRARVYVRDNPMGSCAAAAAVGFAAALLLKK